MVRCWASASDRDLIQDGLWLNVQYIVSFLVLSFRSFFFKFSGIWDNWAPIPSGLMIWNCPVIESEVGLVRFPDPPYGVKLRESGNQTNMGLKMIQCKNQVDGCYLKWFFCLKHPVAIEMTFETCLGCHYPLQTPRNCKRLEGKIIQGIRTVFFSVTSKVLFHHRWQDLILCQTPIEAVSSVPRLPSREGRKELKFPFTLQQHQKHQKQWQQHSMSGSNISISSSKSDSSISISKRYQLQRYLHQHQQQN